MRKSIKSIRAKYSKSLIPKKGTAFEYFGEVRVITKVNKDGSIDTAVPYLDKFGKESLENRKTFAAYDVRGPHLKEISDYWFPHNGPAKAGKG